MTQDYYGTKRVTAWRADGKDGQPGYGVKYADGYQSWSPKDVFEAHYQPLDALSFGHALEVLKAGGRVARAGWNGKGMWLSLVIQAEYSIHQKHLMDIFSDDDELGKELLPWIGMKTADNKFVPWLASQTDVLADDWVALE